MTREILNQIQNINSYPSVSILLPTFRSYPENQQDKIRLKNLVNSAVTRLNKEFNKKELGSIHEKLNSLVENVDFNHLHDGFAVFINKDNDYKFTFDFPVKERLIIDTTFATRDLVFGLNRTRPYYVIIIDEKNTRILIGERENLAEVKHSELPLKNFVHDITSGSIEDTSYNDRIHENDERMKNFTREIVTLFNEIRGENKTPFIIAGTEKQIFNFKEVSKNSDLLLGEITGNYSNLNLSKLAEISWPVAKSGFAQIRNEVADDIETAIGSKKFASGIDEVWVLARQGRGLTLLVETGYSYSAKINKDSGQLIPTNVDIGEEILDDAVDEIIENVISKGGNVIFYDNGMLDKFNKIAMILRY